MENLNELAKNIHENAKNKGFWDEPVQIGVSLMLIVSELAEALEADRKNKKCGDIYNLINTIQGKNILSENELRYFIEEFEDKVKDSFEDELADAVIRILDLSMFMKIDIEKHIQLKMLYNSTREHKHGKKY